MPVFLEHVCDAQHEQMVHTGVGRGSMSDHAPTER